MNTYCYRYGKKEFKTLKGFMRYLLTLNPVAVSIRHYSEGPQAGFYWVGKSGGELLIPGAMMINGC